MKKIYYLLLYFLFCSVNNIQAQVLYDLVDSTYIILPCDSPCVTLHANYLNTYATNQYNVVSTPYSPLSTVGATAVVLNDDKFSSAIPIGFSFCFFEQLYTQVYISDNGHITFNPVFSGGNSSFSTQTALPYTNSTFPDNAIFSPFMDFSPPLGGTIKYITTGTAPFRKFIVEYANVKLFGTSCANVTSTYQVILYEMTNKIECHITDKNNCDNNTTNPKNYGTLGIQNSGATIFYTAPSKNASIWTATNEAWRFEPSGTLNSSMRWKKDFNPTFTYNVASYTVCPPSYPFHVYTTYTTSCPYTIFTDTITINKTLPFFDSIVVIDTPLCVNSANGAIAIYASGGTPPLQYSVNGTPYSTNTVYTNLTSGNISITVKDSNNCIINTISTMPWKIHLSATIDSLKLPTCPSSNGYISIVPSGGTPPYIITWGNGTTGPVLTGFGAGLIYANIVDSNGCSSSFNMVVTFDSVPIIEKTITKPQCFNNMGNIVLNITGGHPPYTYIWNTGAITSSINNLSQAMYSVTVTDVNGCTSNKNIYVEDTLTLTINHNITLTSCNYSNGIIQFAPTDYLPPAQFYLNGILSPQFATNLSAGTYVCKTIDANGCKDSATITIPISNGPIIHMYPSNANCDSSNGKISTLITNDSTFITYMWSNGSNSTDVTNLAPGAYTLTVTNVAGCVDTAIAVIGNDGTPHLIIANYTPPTCYGDSNGSVTLTGTGGSFPYKYSLDNSTFTTIAQINNISGGNYIIYIRDANSCTNDTTVSFSQPAKVLLITNSILEKICYSDTISVQLQTQNGIQPLTYNSNGGAFSSGSYFNNLAVGQYTYIVKDKNNCADTLDITVTGPTAPLQNTTLKQDVDCFKENNGFIHTNTQGGWGSYTYMWSNGSNLSQLDNITSNTYHVTITDVKGCKVEDNITILQRYCCDAVVPNAFTPNNDAKNETLKVLGISDVEYMHFQIYNRWGELVFQTKDITKGWDGTYKGMPAPIETYYFQLSYKCKTLPDKKVDKGDITLVR